MATRVISAANDSEYNYLIGNEESYTFADSLSSDAVVTGGTVSSITISFSEIRHYSDDYYLVVHVGGIKIGETDRISGYQDTSTTTDFTISFDPEDYSSQYFANALTSSGSIAVTAYENGSSSNCLNIRSGCTAEITVAYTGGTTDSGDSGDSGDEETTSSSGKTIGCYLDGEWKACTVKYYDGMQWIDCYIYYFDGSSWQPCTY